ETAGSPPGGDLLPGKLREDPGCERFALPGAGVRRGVYSAARRSGRQPWACFAAKPAQHLAAAHRAARDPWCGEVSGSGERPLSWAVGRQLVGVERTADGVRVKAEQVAGVQPGHTALAIVGTD